MGKGKGGKGKDEWKGKGGKGRYDRYFKGDGHGPQVSPFAAGLAAPLLAVPQFADGSWGKELSGGLHAFDRGHIFFSTKELYFEVLGQCSVHLAVPAPTKIDGRDRQEFANSGPVELAGRSFRNLQELRSEIVTLRKAHSNPPRRLEPEAERLMRSVFEHHPQATEKLKDLQFIQVASNPQSEDPTDVTFFVMRNEQDGDDISYVKCLRAMVTKGGEQMLPLATLSCDHGLNLRVASGNVQIGPSSQGFGVKVDLERLALSVLLTEGLRGPWQLELGRQHSDLPHVPLRVVVEVAEGEAAVIRWAAPFDFAQPRPPKPPKPPTPPGQELALPALEDQFRSEELKRSLEAMMKDQNIPGDLSSLSVEELQRIAMQIVVKSLGASLHVTRSAGACAVQNQSLLRIAREQGMELTCQQLQDARTELQKVKEERYTAEATLNQLREEMAVLRRKVTQVEGEREAPVVPDAPRRAPQAAGCAVAATELEELRRKLQAELPELAGSMLRNSLKLMSSELYSGPSRALWELLQNADDCSYDQEAEMQIEQTGNYLWIEYNERGFSWEDVEALCSLGSSTKGIAQTGEKGVGFKSAFVLSSRPHILSNPYRFFFDETASCPLPHVTPQRLLADATLPRRPPERGAAVYLPLRKDFPELLNEIVPESLLFLRRLHHVTVGRSSFSLRHQNGRSTLLVADSSGTKEHHYIIARAQELAIAFPLAGGGPAALLSATLPIHWLEGLKTPLNAPFELTANREALRENSQRNVELRDALAELFLQAAAEQEILSSRVWQLQPDAEGGGFWAPFVQRVRAGLQEVPLIPVIDAGQKNRWALKRCRNPSSELLRDLNLLPSDLEKVGLAIPTEEFLRQLPEGSEFNLPEFDAKDLLCLLQCGDISTTWRSYGNEWRQRVVGALERRLSEVDLALRATLRSLALFPTGADDWSSCDDQIYLSLPEGAPEGLLKALHSSRACAADRALLTALGGGGVATARDVAYAVLQRGLGLADVEDRRFSWTNLAYLGHHWQSILQCGAADEWLAKQTPEQMEELLRSVALPSCSGRLLHCASELRCPFLLGCKSSAADRSNLLAEPPGANDIQARLRWELVFLRLGAQVAEDQGLQLPRNFFAEGVGKELGPLLDHYEQLGVLQTISKKCCIPDRTGCICQAGHLLGPAFQPLLGPDGIVDLADDCAEEAVRLLGVVVTPTALLVAQMLKRAAQGGTKTLRRSYEFLSAEWREGRVDEESLLTLKNGMWMLNCEGDLSFEQVADVTWEDVQRQISLWSKDGLHGIFRAMGVSPSTGAEAATPPEASQPANGQNRSGERPPAKSSSQPLTWPALPQVRSMAEDGGGAPVAAGNSANPPAFREPSGAQLPLLGKLLQQIFYSAGGDDMLYGRLGKETREMLASDIHFTHNSISRRFGHGELKGRQVEDVAKALREGNMTTKELPLVVVKFESNYYTLNNRSLYALRKASRAQKPLRAQVAAFETMCPVTAKFIQLRCSSLAGQDESLAQRATNSSEEEA